MHTRYGDDWLVKWDGEKVSIELIQPYEESISYGEHVIVEVLKDQCICNTKKEEAAKVYKFEVVIKDTDITW